MADTSSKTYTQQQNIKYSQQLTSLLNELPDFCMQYFDSLEYTKQPRTKVAYAMDIKGFFEYLCFNSNLFNYESIKEFNINDLEKLSGQDINNYMRYVKAYSRDGSVVTNSEKAAKRKLCSLRGMYNFFFRYVLML